jgi:hypothetical protein
MIQRMPLKIPTGYAIGYSEFYDVDPVLIEESKESILENSFYFQEDLLQVMKMDIKEGEWYIPSKHLLIDLGWYPDGKSNGNYRLILAIVEEGCEWDVLKEFRSQNRYEIQHTIEKWMESMIEIR